MDTADHQVKLFDLQGKPDVWGERGEGLEIQPPDLHRGRPKLHVADTINARIQTQPVETGKHLATVGKLACSWATWQAQGCGADSEGNIYVVESFYDHLLIYNPKGEF